MNLNNLHLITVLLVLLKVFNVINISWWIVFLPSAISLTIFILVITITLKVMLKENMTIEEFNELMKKDNKKKDDE